MRKRIGLIGDNSIQYVDRLLQIWNNGDSAVLIDYHIPALQSLEMLKAVSAESCYVDNHIWQEFLSYNQSDFFFPYESSFNHALLPNSIRSQYVVNKSNEEAVVFFSSGTTGAVKGIRLSHKAITLNAEMTQDCIKLEQSDVFYMAKPFSHSSSLVCSLLPGLLNNIQLLFTRTALPIRNIVKALNTYQVTTFSVVPSQLTQYVRFTKQYGEITSFHRVNVGGDTCPAQLQWEAQNALNAEILVGYGQTEAGPRVTGQPARGKYTLGSVGWALRDIGVVVTDHTGNECVAGQSGILSVKTDCRMLGYTTTGFDRQPVYSDWLNTGDLGYKSSDGEIFITGRVDDMLIHNGCNIFPGIIEDKIKSILPEISECLVFGVKESSNDKIICYYVSTGKTGIKELRALCAQYFASYEMPSDFVKVNSIPSTNNGKPSRVAASQDYLGQIRIKGE